MAEYVDDQVINKFLDELESLYRKYGLSLSHEDTHGAFIIKRLDEGNILWVRAAMRDAKYE